MARKQETLEKVISTKEKILITSLRLFSEKGFDGVNMREIASAVGIKGASIYAHYKGKQDIFNAIFEDMKSRYDKVASELFIPDTPNEDAVKLFANADINMLINMTEQLFALYAHDEFMVLTRRLLKSEQNHNELAAKYLREYYIDAPVNFQTQLFVMLQGAGAFVGCDARTLAISFYSPIYYELSAFDLGKPYEECLVDLKQHVKNFGKV